MSSTPLFHQIPFFRLTSALVIGIFISSVVPLSLTIGYILLFLSIIGVIISNVIDKRKTLSYSFRWIYGVSIIGIFMSLGMLLYQHKIQELSIELPDNKKTFIATISESPIEKPKSVMTVVTIAVPEINKTHRAILYLEKDSASKTVQYGDYLLVNTLLQKPRNTGNPYEFDYSTFLLHKGITATSYINKGSWKQIKKTSSFSVTKHAINTRNKLLNIYKKYGITDNEFGIVAALTVGYKEGLSKETKQSFSITGGSHVLAVSGLHVGIIYLALGFMLGFMAKSKQGIVGKQIILIASIWAYAFICGLPPSVVRASIMISLICISEILNRKSATYNAVFVSGFCMLIYNPLYLFDVGFQLSYMAVLSILYFQPRINNIFSPNHIVIKWLWSLTAVSIAAQIGTAPISLYYFHNFPTYFLLTNIIVIPAATIIIYLSIVLLLLSSWVKIGLIVAWLLKSCVQIISIGIHFIEHLPGASIPDIWIPIWFMPIVFLSLVSTILFIRTQRSRYFFLIFYLSILSISIAIWNRFQTLQNKELIVYANNPSEANFNIHIISGESNTLLADTIYKANLEQYVNTVTHKKHLNPARFEQIDMKNSFGCIDTLTYFVYTNPTKWKPIDISIPVDIVFVYEKRMCHVTEITSHVSPTYIVFGENINGKQLQILKEECEKKSINYHSLYEKGAFILPL